MSDAIDGQIAELEAQKKRLEAFKDSIGNLEYALDYIENAKVSDVDMAFWREIDHIEDLLGNLICDMQNEVE